ncbi:hypothetical protein UlMin_009995 [Ulmus minor]
MKTSTRLDSVLFQLTPTRTRCELVISANGKTEKIASGLLNPFLAHLKTAQEQMAKGGYSITLMPEPGADASWFTKGTVERFVRFVSNPEVLERVYTLESEILQIEQAITIQGNNDMGLSAVEENQAKPMESNEGSRTLPDTNEEKAIVLYKPEVPPPEANRSTSQEGNSKVQLLKVLETRKTVLQKEQGMAFARAVAAGFDIDNMTPLMLFSECFGASRLMDGCKRFKELWKKKHETGQWVEIEAAEAMSNRSDFSAMNASGIMLSSLANRQKEALPESFAEMASESNGRLNRATSADEKPLENQLPPGHQEYFQGQFPHQMFPPWPMHSPPGALPVYQPYPMQGIPYYQNYPGTGPYFQPPYPPVEDPRLNSAQKTRQRRHSMDGSISNVESEARSSDDAELEKESSESRESRKRGSRSGKKQSGMVVIRNINYITAKGHNSSDAESQSDSDSQTDEEDGGKNSLRSSKSKGKTLDKEEMAPGKEAESGHWQAFQNFLLRDADEDRQSVDQGMFANEKKVQSKRRQRAVGDDPLAFGGQDNGEIQNGSGMDMQRINGDGTRIRRTSADELLISKRDGSRGGSMDGQVDLQSAEMNGRRLGRSSNDDFMIRRSENQSGFTSSSSDPLAVNGFDHGTNNMDRRSSQNMDDDSYVVSLRPTSLYQGGNNGRNAIDMDSEFPSTTQKAERAGIQVNYEPEELTLMLERGTENGTTGYDPALDYEMQAQARDKRNKEVVAEVKQGSKKSDKGQKSKLLLDDRKKNVGPIRRGKPSKLSPLDEARARAEKLRTYKADLQKIKKEKEEAEIKRLEALKMERQKRIGARGGTVPAQSSEQRKRVPTKTSPVSLKGSKFSDAEPGALSPLQKYPARTSSAGSIESLKTSKPRKLNAGSQSAGNRLTRSSSSLPESKKANDAVPSETKASMARIRRLSEPKMVSDGVTSETKASMVRIRRLSEPKMSSSNQVSSQRVRSAESVSKSKASDGSEIKKLKASDGSEIKKLSAIVNYDKTKAASLPELKIRTPKANGVTQSKSATKETTQKGNLNKSSTTSEGAEANRNEEKISLHSEGDENPVIEKTVVMLESEKPSISAVNVSVDNLKAEYGHTDSYKIRENTEVVSDYAAIRAPVTPIAMGSVDVEPDRQIQEQNNSYEVAVGDAKKELPKVSSNGSTEKQQYLAPYARVSSFEHPCTENSDYEKAPPTNLLPTASSASVKAHVYDSGNLKLEKIPETLEKPQVKESSKGFRRLLKFGRKSSTSFDKNAEAENSSINGSEAEDNVTNTAVSSEVHTLKNLISQDETPSASVTPQKTSRHFSLLSPFRSKNSEKKATT